MEVRILSCAHHTNNFIEDSPSQVNINPKVKLRPAYIKETNNSPLCSKSKFSYENVEKVVSAAEALIEPLLTKQHTYWDERLAKSPGSIEADTRAAELHYIEPRFRWRLWPWLESIARRCCFWRGR